ncbi:hypothetical protein [Enterovirga sp. CN4-39]|uniref:hypothetical protein n=1 Tax=Enterovirga sp. CN4-39 TaxID=3400910 RepID=UPI003C06E0B7
MPKLRVEFHALGSGRGRLGGQIDCLAATPLGSATLEVGSVATAPEDRLPVPTGQGTVFARLLAVESAIYADVGLAPDPDAEPRLLLLPGRAQLVHVLPGQSIAAILASDVSAPADSGGAALVDRSGTLSASGVAQQACPANPGRRFLLIANPDETRSFWFSAGGAASTGAGSVQVGPGGAFAFDKVVPAGAISVCGPASGQPFTVAEA